MRCLTRMLLFSLALLMMPAAAQTPTAGGTDLDRRVQDFLNSRKGTWRDLNVGDFDGRTLHDLIVKNGFRRAVEIGTSTGHSGIWIGWALSKTGGKLTTIEIDPRRHAAATANFRAAGLSGYIDARRANAHELVPKLEGPIDFVFSDADKDWYTNYFVALWPKIVPGGCFTAHNISMNQRGVRGFLEHLKTVSDATSTIVRRADLSVTCKRGA